MFFDRNNKRIKQLGCVKLSVRSEPTKLLESQIRNKWIFHTALSKYANYKLH